MKVAAAFACGLLFGAGILVSGMSNPAKVLAFFDFTGRWDPSLALVMIGAIAVTAAGYRLVWRRQTPFLEPVFDLPTARRIDAKLVGGAAVFGIGWGLVGFCPGGSLPMLGSGRIEPVLFIAGLVAGLLVTRQVREWLAGAGPQSSPPRTPAVSSRASGS